jgi:hypothetical protein
VTQGAVNSDLTALKDKLANKQKEMADELTRAKKMLELADREKTALSARCLTISTLSREKALGPRRSTSCEEHLVVGMGTR